MNRQTLKKMIGDYRPSLIRPEMLEDPYQRKLARLQERAWLRYERDKRTICANRSLNEAAIGKAWDKARKRFDAGMEKLRPLRRICDRRSERVLLRIMADAKKWKTSAAGRARRRVAA